MILADEADVLEEAFFRADVSDVSRLDYRQKDLSQYVDYLGIERDVVPELYPYFSISEETRCEKHNVPISSCGCPESRETETAVCRLKPEELVADWVKTLREKNAFDAVNWKSITPTRHVLTARFDNTEVTFQCFFNRDEFEKYDFEHQALEFGVSFFGDASAVEREYCYSWREFLDDDFREQFISEVQRLREAIGVDFYEYEPLEGYRDRVRQSLRRYFSESGYEVRREVGEVCAAETIQYNIDTGKTDFVGYEGESKFVVCHCDKTPGWHVHHFRDGRIESAEQTDVIEDMTGKIEDKINTYQDIREDKQTASRFVSVLATFFSIGFVVLLFDRLGAISAILQEYVVGWNLELAAVILLLVNGVAAIALAIVIVKPYAHDLIFEWEIDPLDMQNADESNS